MIKMNRRVVVTGCVFLATVGLVGFALAETSSTERGGGRVTRQSFAVVQGDHSTSSSDWTTIAGLKVRTSCPRSQTATATASLALTPASDPVDVRVVMRDSLVTCVDCATSMTPDSVSLYPGTSSFTFATDRSVGEHGTIFTLQWRIRGEPRQSQVATLDDASLGVFWDKDAARCR